MPQPEASLNIIFVGKRKIKELNSQFLNHQGPTDVITFDYLDDPILCPDDKRRLFGEIFICVDVASNAAREYNLTVSEEIILYIVHGILHLCGLKDKEVNDICLMREKEQVILSKLNQKFTFSDLFIIK